MYFYTVKHPMRLYLYFQIPDKVIDSDPRVRVLVDVSLFPGLVEPPIWLHSHFQALGKVISFEPRACVMNIEWDYSYYQPWSDNKWLVDKMLAMREEMLITQDEDIIMQ